VSWGRLCVLQTGEMVTPHLFIQRSWKNWVFIITPLKKQWK
jgi:hypothetical protein